MEPIITPGSLYFFSYGEKTLNLHQQRWRTRGSHIVNQEIFAIGKVSAGVYLTAQKRQRIGSDFIS